MATSIKFAPVFGEPAPSAGHPYRDYITAWQNYLNVDINRNAAMPEMPPPRHFEDYHASMIELCSIGSSESAEEKTAEAKQLLSLLGYYHVLADFERCENELSWKMLTRSGYRWSIFHDGSMANVRRCLFDEQCGEQLGSMLKSGETVVLFYFGHSDRENGDWIVEDDLADVKNDSGQSGKINVSRAFHRLLSKFVRDLAARLQTERPLVDVGLVIVSDSCSSGALCDQLQQFSQQQIVCGSDKREVRDILEACKCAIAAQASCSSDELAYSRFFTPLFTALQHADKFEFYSDIKWLLNCQSNSGKECDLAFVKSPSLRRIRPAQTPKFSVIGQQDCVNRLQQQIHFFDSDDANSLRVFWEYYALGIMGLDWNDKVCSIPVVRSRNLSACGDKCVMDVTVVSPTGDDMVASSINDTILRETWPIDDVVAYCAGKVAYGFVVLVTIGEQKFSLHLHCTPDVKLVTRTNEGVPEDERVLHFKPFAGTTYNFADIERLHNDYTGVAFRVRATSKEDAREELLKLKHYQIQLTELQVPIERPVGKREKVFVFPLTRSGSERFCSLVNMDQPCHRENANVTVFAYPYRAAHAEYNTRPLIKAADELVKHERMWLEAMLDNVQVFLCDHSDLVVYVQDKQGKQVTRSVNAWLKDVATFFGNELRGSRFKQFEMYGSVCSTFSALV